jgi:signal transduction histidine kinase/CheY-like chemotaxis protein
MLTLDSQTNIELYKKTLACIDDIVIWLNADLDILFCNQNPKALVGLHIETLTDLDQSLSWKTVLSDLKTQNEAFCFSGNIDLELIYKDLSPNKPKNQYTRFTIHSLADFQRPTQKSEAKSDVAWLVLCSDLTHFQAHMSSTAKAQELSEALTQIEVINTELAKSVQAKDEFLASMSHELRTPLNAILGLCEAILEGVYGRLETDLHQPIRQVFSNGHHLLSVISDILDLSKLRAGGISLSMKDLDVEACCFEALQVFRGEMQKKCLAVNVSIEGVYVLNADERWFKQVLMNLISNAVKFTKSNHRVGINVGVSPISGFLRVTVWDEGIGISKENLPRLFQNFVQLDTSLARAYEGTGLGLSIVSQVMSLHGGEIHVESELDQGSKFHLDFPWLPDYQVMNKEIEENTPPDLKSVLLVEDSTIDADRIKRYLDETDTEVIWDKRGGDAVKLAKEQNPDVIILDLFLPESSGWDILKQLKQNPLLSKIPVVVCSVLPQDERRSENQLIQGYLQKPFSRRALEKSLISISRLLNHSKEVNSKIDLVEPEGPILDKALMISANEIQNIQSIEVSVNPKVDVDVQDDYNTQRITSPTVLIVDDNLSNIQLVRDYLKRKGYNILTAEDGYQAVQVTRLHQPGLILMDIQMPHMDGIEATTHIKDDPNISDIPIFALTALAMPGDRERCINAGMSEYFTKPVSLRGLYKKVKETIGP